MKNGIEIVLHSVLMSTQPNNLPTIQCLRVCVPTQVLCMFLKHDQNSIESHA